MKEQLDQLNSMQNIHHTFCSIFTQVVKEPDYFIIFQIRVCFTCIRRLLVFIISFEFVVTC